MKASTTADARVSPDQLEALIKEEIRELSGRTIGVCGIDFLLARIEGAGVLFDHLLQALPKITARLKIPEGLINHANIATFGCLVDRLELALGLPWARSIIFRKICAAIAEMPGWERTPIECDDVVSQTLESAACLKAVLQTLQRKFNTLLAEVKTDQTTFWDWATELRTQISALNPAETTEEAVLRVVRENAQHADAYGRETGEITTVSILGELGVEQFAWASICAALIESFPDYRDEINEAEFRSDMDVSDVIGIVSPSF